VNRLKLLNSDVSSPTPEQRRIFVAAFQRFFGQNQILLSSTLSADSSIDNLWIPVWDTFV